MKLRLHLKHPRHIISTTAFWLVACLPWITLAILFLLITCSDMYPSGSPNLPSIALFAPVLASGIRNDFLETSEEKEKRTQRISPLLYIILAPSITSMIRGLFLDAPEEKEKIIQRMHGSISKWSILGIFVLIFVMCFVAIISLELCFYLADCFLGNGPSWPCIAMMLVAFVVIPRDMILQYRRAQK